MIFGLVGFLSRWLSSWPFPCGILSSGLVVFFFVSNTCYSFTHKYSCERRKAR